MAAGAAVFGPTLRMFGKELSAASEQRVKNLLSIISRAQERGGDAPNDESVSPRLLSEMVNEGSWVSDSVAQEYLAGLLISARSREADDENLEYVQGAARLTSRQIRLHHAVYSTFARKAPKKPWSMGVYLGDHAVWAPLADAANLLGVSPDDAEFALMHDMSALRRRDFLDNGATGWNDGSADLFDPPLRSRTDEAPLIAWASQFGMLLFLRAHGIRTYNPDAINDIDWNQFAPLGPGFPRSAVAGVFDAPERVEFKQ